MASNDTEADDIELDMCVYVLLETLIGLVSWTLS